NRVASCLEGSVQAPPTADTMARWRTEFTRPVAHLSNHLWTFTRVDSEPSAIAFALGQGFPPWLIGMFDVLGRADVSRLNLDASSLDDRETITKAVGIVLGWVLPLSAADTSFAWAFGG